MKIFWLVLFVAIAVGYYLGGDKPKVSTLLPTPNTIAVQQPVKTPAPDITSTATLSRAIEPAQDSEGLKEKQLMALEKKRDTEEADMIQLRDAAGEIFRKQGLIE